MLSYDARKSRDGTNVLQKKGETGATTKQLMTKYDQKSEDGSYTRSADQKRLTRADMHLTSMGEAEPKQCPTFQYWKPGGAFFEKMQ